MPSRTEKLLGWIRPLDLTDTGSYHTAGPVISQRAVSVRLGDGGTIDLWLEDDGRLHFCVDATHGVRRALLIGVGADGEGFEIVTEKVKR